MRTHQEIDQRSLALARMIVSIIDAQDDQQGLQQARAVCARWLAEQDSPAIREWHTLLQNPWPIVRERYTDPSEKGCHLRQNSPFCGILSPRQRWDFLKEWKATHEQSAA